VSRPAPQVSFWGRLILQLRTERGWTQRDLSEMARVARSTLVSIELGRVPGRIDAIEKLLGCFDYELDAIDRLRPGAGARASLSL
jgi:transcriptional regulator with XRE-family HTH domain